ncbi:MAG: hypothetical protein HQM08_28890 [Candidatus Riflebacteria bacterium]|nr:hypothetical protein [Candidatus Riflebacteria bacterium]
MIKRLSVIFFFFFSLTVWLYGITDISMLSNNLNDKIDKQLKDNLNRAEFEEAHYLGMSRPSPAIDGKLTQHMKDSMRINAERKPYYAKKSNNATIQLSDRMISIGKTGLMIGSKIDRWGEKFNRQGIPIIQNDVVSMSTIPAMDTLPIRKGVLTPEQQKDVKAQIFDFQTSMFTMILSKDFQNISLLASQFLKKIKAFEEVNSCNLTMVRHLVESVGYIALHSIDYDKQSKGATRRLSQSFLLVHLVSLRYAPDIDFQAQPFHKLGIGIVLNEIPQIPFEKEMINTGN